MVEEVVGIESMQVTFDFFHLVIVGMVAIALTGILNLCVVFCVCSGLGKVFKRIDQLEGKFDKAMKDGLFKVQVYKKNTKKDPRKLLQEEPEKNEYAEQFRDTTLRLNDREGYE